MSQKAEESAKGQGAKSGASPLTLEVVLWGAILALAGWLRLYALGRWALSEAEATLAREAWNYYWHGPGSGPVRLPLLFWGDLLSFAFLGGGDYAARLPSAMMGVALVGSPALARKWLGRWGALAASLMLAVSPSFLYLSRTLSEEVAVAVAFGFLACGLFRWAEGGKWQDLALAAGALAAGLTTGASFYDLLAMLAGFLALAWLIGRKGGSALGAWWGFLMWPLQELPARKGQGVAIGALVAFLLLSSGLGAHPQGVSAAIYLFPEWLASFRAPWDGLSLRGHLGILGIYEFGMVLLGLGGLAYGLLRRRSPFFLFLAFWLVFLAALEALRPAPWRGGVAYILVPLVWGAGFLAGDFAEELERGCTWREAMLGSVGLGMAFYEFLWLAAFARERSLTFPSTLYIYLGLLALAAGGLLSWRWLGGGRTVALGGALTVVFALGFSFHTSVNLSYYHGGDPVERWASSATSEDVRRLVRLLEDYSAQEANDAHLVGVEIDERLEGVLGWYLRDFKKVRFTLRPHLSATTPVAILPQGEPFESEGDFLYQSLKLRESWAGGGFGTPAWWRWYLYREVDGGYRAERLELCIREVEPLG